VNRIVAALCISFVAVVAPSRAFADEAADPTVLLHVDSPRAVAVERADDGAFVCTSPCNTRVPATTRYRIAGSRASEPFILDARQPRASIAVDPATKRSYLVGLGAFGLGSAVAIAGGIILGVAAASSEPIPADGATTNTDFTDAVTAGTVMVITGIAGAIWGGGTAIANAKTRVTGDVVGPAPARGLAPSPRTQAAVAPPPFIMIPILGGTF
jgi:hypothetical protein